MGVYSEAAVAQMREAQAVNAFKFTDLLEFAVNTERNNQNMFNALLELDFQDAVTVQNGGYLTEAEEAKAENKAVAKLKAIGQQIIKALEKFLEMLGTFWKKFVAKVADFTGVNKGLVKKFGSIVIADVKAGLGENSELKLVKYEDKDIFDAPVKKLQEVRAKYVDLFNIAESKEDRGPVKDLVDEAIDAINNEDCSVSDEAVASVFSEVDVNTYYAEIGDIIQVGYKDIYSHSTVVSSKVIKDDKVIDILLNSNTTDLENYPLSAYIYPNERLIKILGWNN